MYKQLFIKVFLLGFLGTGFYFAQKSTTEIALFSPETSTSLSQLVEATQSEQLQAELKPQTTLLSASLVPQIEILDTPRVDVLGPQLQGTSGDGIVKMKLRATAYNSLTSQTDSTPFITATGAKTRFGIVAVSRDMLDEELPYGSLVKLKDLGHYKNGRTAGSYDELLSGQVFIVEDTMHQRKRQQMDVWFPTYSQATNWGVRQIEVEVVRYGRTGPRLDGIMIAKEKSDFSPVLSMR